MIPRTINLSGYKNSLFLFGARQVGKTYLIKHTLSFDLFIDLLKHAEFLRYARDPSILTSEVEALKKKKCRVVIDEIQRCPGILDEVQLIMGNNPEIQFILTGSSARKLKRAGVNLLGGRAITVHLHPFTCEELGIGLFLMPLFITAPFPLLSWPIIRKIKYVCLKVTRKHI